MKKPQSRTWRRQSPQASSFSQQWNVYCNVHSENVLLRHREGGGNVPPRLALVELQKMNRHSRGREVSRDNLWTAWFYGGSWVMEECGTKRSFVLTEQSLFVLTEGYVVKKGCVCMCVCVCVCAHTQWCPTLCDPMDCSLPGSSVYGILQARILEWVAIPFSRGSSHPRDRTSVSCIGGWIFFLPLTHLGCSEEGRTNTLRTVIFWQHSSLWIFSESLSNIVCIALARQQLPPEACVCAWVLNTGFYGTVSPLLLSSFLY